MKKLNLDRSKLDETVTKVVHNLCSPQIEIEIYKNTNICKGFSFNYKNERIVIDFYVDKKGATTITYKVGQNHNLSYKIGCEIKQELLLDNRENFNHYFRNIEEKDFQLLIDYLCNECNGTCIEDNTNNNSRIVKLRGEFKDKITLTRFKSGSFRVQGKPIYLYKEMCFFLPSVINSEQIIKIQNEISQVDISATTIESEFDYYFYHSKNFIKDVKNIIIPSLSLKHVEIQTTDYSFFVCPILKGVEGYIKLLLLKFNIFIPNNKGIATAFYKDVNGFFKLNRNSVILIPQSYQQNAIETVFNFFKQERDSLFHTDGIPINSRIIDTYVEALELVDNCISIIESTYKEFSNNI